jgi:hypothetical protein
LRVENWPLKNVEITKKRPLNKKVIVDVNVIVIENERNKDHTKEHAAPLLLEGAGGRLSILHSSLFTSNGPG